MIDTTPPIVTVALASDTGSSATDKITNNPTLAGTAEANRVVTVLNGATTLGTTTAAANGSWTFTPTLTDGSYTLTASETDAAGNTGSTTLAFTLDTAAPAVSLALASDTGPNAFDRVTSNAALRGTAVANQIVTVSNGATTLGTTRADANGSWTFTPTLADGNYTLTASETDIAGNVGSATLGFTLETAAPTVTAVTANPSNGTFGAGALVRLSVVLSQVVAVSGGQPYLMLSDGGIATYTSGSGTRTLSFVTAVKAGQTTADLAVTSVSLNGATVMDGAGIAALLTGAAVNPVGTLAISTPSVTITGITATPSAAGPLNATKTVRFTVALGQPVTVNTASGSPVLTLNNNATAAFNAAASTSTSLVFNYTVAAGQDTADLKVHSVTLNGATVTNASTLSFASASTYAAGSAPNAVTTADVNGDGRSDIITADQNGTVAVLLGSAAGTFGTATTYAAGQQLNAVTTADVNGDGYLDLITADQSNAVEVLLGSAAGTFGAATTYSPSSGLHIVGVTTADVNGDGYADIVAVTDISQVYVLLGSAAGTFGTATTYTAGSNLTSVAVADVNGDGQLDLVLGDQSRGIIVLPGTGGGSFGTAATYTVPGGAVASLTVADVNGDGTPDIVYADGQSKVGVLLGAGNGSFGTATLYSASGGAKSVTVSDVSGDGLADLVAVGQNAVTVLLGTSSGTFATGKTFAAGGQYSVSIARADLNGDGKPDLIVANRDSNSVSVLLDNSTASINFDPTSTASAAGSDTGLVIDTTPPANVTIRLASDTGVSATDRITGNPTLTGTGEAGTTVTVLNGTTVLGTTTVSAAGSWSFTPKLPSGAYTLTASDVDAAGNVATATLAFQLARPTMDFNSDGYSDLLVSGDNGSAVVATLVGLTVTSLAPVATPGAGWNLIGSGDLDGDGQADLVFQNIDGRVEVEVLDGTTVRSTGILANPGASWHVRGIADFNNDGRADLLLQNTADGSLELVATNAGGTSAAAPASLGTFGASWHVEGVGDFDGDGLKDGLFQNDDGRVGVVLQGNFAAGLQVLGNPGAGATIAGTGDYSGDGKTDALVHQANGTVLLGTLNGATVTGLATVGNPGAAFTSVVAGADYDGDGKLDVAVQATDSTIAAATLDGSSNAVITASAVLGQAGAGERVVGNVPTMFLDGTAAGTLAATPGADAFLLSTPAVGTHTITGFDPVLDRIVLSAAKFSSYAAVQAAETQSASGTTITLANFTTAQILGITPSQLSASNFALV